MGINLPPENCFLTHQKTTNYSSSSDLIEYTVKINDQNKLFKFYSDHSNNPYVEKNKYIIHALLLNEKFPVQYLKKEGKVIDNDFLEKLINESVIPRFPDEKIENLLNYLHSIQDYEGSRIRFPQIEKGSFARSLYFKNHQELVFYLSTLINLGYITGGERSTTAGTDIVNINLTYAGLSKIIEFQENESQSNRCFIAMSFSNNHNQLREKIKDSVIKTGYHPILIDEIHYDSDISINDALIAEIKKCKFLVADFTDHKHGVYFEAGFALGLKRPVIYLCNNEDFDKTHFDTNHYPHIIYSDLDEMQKGLENKINAWIN
ncbi:nucleoside 2-deoxyribosyltransferase-like protein [Gillisia mitskevichiae]|uniref:Nucleoside 2-deoxyribosyltransferase-like protein n=1 Tax=Gillisia mitskevichiae TaxID=270921 RepID=A0A495NXB1_9FLAO|nr:nucleoside 2-deoxyribosyltransferase [Gillisia mitskevichiae]RKS42507.1 nucleoside 2-deoxyribosyltransferase-like protein [Gillisia mitskevichiae]